AAVIRDVFPADDRRDLLRARAPHRRRRLRRADADPGALASPSFGLGAVRHYRGAGAHRRADREAAAPEAGVDLARPGRGDRLLAGGGDRLLRLALLPRLTRHRAR